MRKFLNIAIVVLLYAAGALAARFMLHGEYSAVASDITRWLWGLGVLIIGTLSQLLWKVHEAKRVEGLSVEQRARVRHVAGLIGLRIYLLMAIVFLASVIGFISNFVAVPVAAKYMAQASLGSMLASAVLWLTWVHMAQRDIQRFEDKAREELAQQKAADALAERLKKSLKPPKTDS
ncbi:hypothetical protein [Stenotrophomonas sp. MMGLT7]|uniref:hypothetical protein n=1 Tax=Stenotrophomonas sp. MMGLT7 TaxID=2901227 RepID=UPI001E5058E5|nr:hypothetical protein [Stenotrophomonas sp. MMGLT7]MCD7096972.1 hypothetical protein [Stenotrophomonas sp. MMGLT7]